MKQALSELRERTTARLYRVDAEAGRSNRRSHRARGPFRGVELGTSSHSGTAEPTARSSRSGRDPDVLDTWFSSGIWPIGTLGWPEDTPELRRYYPTSTLVTGFDIIFFWVARMMMMQLELTGDVPFREVYIHALVRDEKGKKMSKSLGNILDPIELIDKYGADAVRFTLTAMAAMGRDLKLSEERIAGYRNFGTKLWNAARFAEMNDCRPDPAFDPRSRHPHRQQVDRRRDRPPARDPRRRPRPPTASTTPPTRSTPTSGARSATGTSSWPNPSSTATAPPRPAPPWPGSSTSA